MPELPELEGLTDFLDRRLRSRQVARAELASFAALKSVGEGPQQLLGQTCLGVNRRGKYLCLQFSETWLVAHLARGGWVHWYESLPQATARPGRSPIALRLGLLTEPEDAAPGLDITEAGTQKRLALWLVPDPGDLPQIRALGIDPLDPRLDATYLGGLLQRFPGTVKAALTSQSLLAGVGNAYSDEALHLAHLSPFKAAARMSEDEVSRLHSALVSLLGPASERARGLEPAQLKDGKRQAMRVHGRTGQPCPECGDTVREVAFATRSLQYCPTCQTGGKPLADRRLSRLLR